MHPLPANDGKEQESAGVTSDVELSQEKVSTQGNTNQMFMIYFHLLF